MGSPSQPAFPRSPERGHIEAAATLPAHDRRSPFRAPQSAATLKLGGVGVSHGLYLAFRAPQSAATLKLRLPSGAADRCERFPRSPERGHIEAGAPAGIGW